MRLSGSQYKQLLNALLSAFSTLEALEAMVQFQLGENLQAITGRDGLNATIFDLIRWTEARGKTQRLIEGALEENPTNPGLREFAESVGIAVPDVDEQEAPPAVDESDTSSEPDGSEGSTRPTSSQGQAEFRYENFDLLITRAGDR